MDNNEMTDYTQVFGTAQQETTVAKTAAVFRGVYGWMCAGLTLSGVVAWYTAASGLYRAVLTGPGFAVCIIAELALVWILSACVHKMPVFLATLMFTVYAAVNGLTLSVVFIAYELAAVWKTFLITAGMFGGLALYGTLTRSNLAKIGSICGLALWGVVIALIVNIFFQSSQLDWIVSFVGVLVFTGLTMWDAQKIKLAASDAQFLAQPGAVARLSVIGALELYLDFINLFLMLLRFFGGRSRD